MQHPCESLAAPDAKTLAVLQTARDRQQQGEPQVVSKSLVFHDTEFKNIVELY